MIDLEKWRAADRATKNRNALLIALGCTAILAVGWLTTVPTRLSVLTALEPVGTSTANREAAGDTPGPLNTVLERTRSQIGELRGAWLSATGSETPAVREGVTNTELGPTPSTPPEAGESEPVRGTEAGTTTPTPGTALPALARPTSTASGTAPFERRIIQISTSSPATTTAQ